MADGKEVAETLSVCDVNELADLDIKPQSILIDKHSYAQSCDFGLAMLAAAWRSNCLHLFARVPLIAPRRPA
jgi:serine/threonine protein kinase